MNADTVWTNEYVVDCEYDYATQTLISIAIVPLFDTQDPQHEFYFEIGPLRNDVDPWVADNVYPLLDHQRLLSYQEVQVLLSEYLRRLQPTRLHFDWPEDILYFSKLLLTGPGQRLELPPLGFGLIYHPNLGSLSSSTPHHALYDARGLVFDIRQRLLQSQSSEPPSEPHNQAE